MAFWVTKTADALCIYLKKLNKSDRENSIAKGTKTAPSTPDCNF